MSSPSTSSLPIFFFLTIWLDLLLLNAAVQAAQYESVLERDRRDDPCTRAPHCMVEGDRQERYGGDRQERQEDFRYVLDG